MATATKKGDCDGNKDGGRATIMAMKREMVTAKRWQATKSAEHSLTH